MVPTMTRLSNFPRSLTLLIASLFMTASDVWSQTLINQVVHRHRQSVVHLTVSKTDDDTGAVYVSTATGVILSPQGHVLTSCHVVEKAIRNEKGKLLPVNIKKVSIAGAVASKAGFAEPMSLIACEQPGIDLALLKFQNTSVTRVPVKPTHVSPEIGDDLAAIGFPLETEFFARGGTVSSEGEEDRLLLNMVLNTGDSGAPVFNRHLNVVAVAEAGYDSGTGIGVARPIRHGAHLLSVAGIDLFAVNLPAIDATPAADKPVNSNIFNGSAVSINKIFQQPAGATQITAPEVTVTHPVLQIFAPTTNTLPEIDLKTFAAQPGYKVTRARFIVTEESGAQVVNVGASPDGTAARATFEKSGISALSAPRPFVKGYLETTQERIK